VRGRVVAAEHREPAPNGEPAVNAVILWLPAMAASSEWEGKMLGRKGFVLAVGIVLALGVVALGSDRASGQAEIHVLIPTGGSGAVVGGWGFELGDQLAGHAALVDPASGESAGTAYLECTVMRKIHSDNQGLRLCSYHLNLSDGGIVLQGLDPRGAGTSTFAVLGGTKMYRGASGDAVFTDSDDGTDIVITLT
jgi:hypothetical protein